MRKVLSVLLVIALLAVGISSALWLTKEPIVNPPNVIDRFAWEWRKLRRITGEISVSSREN